MPLSASTLEQIRIQARLILDGHTGFAREILRNGTASIAFVPDNPNYVVKIIKSGERPFGTSLGQEFDLLNRFGSLCGDRFVIPKGLAIGSDPDFLVMDRLGPSWTVESVTADVIDHIGLAVGEFAGKLFNAHRVMHMDLFTDNLTREKDGRIGIVDIASILPCDEPERMFICPILDEVNFCPAMAQAFMHETGYPIKIARVEELIASQPKDWCETQDPNGVAVRSHARIATRFAEWRAVESQGFSALRRGMVIGAAPG